MLLIVAMVAAFRRWEELWRAGGTRAQFLGSALAMCAALFALSGIRWYFAVIAWGASALFFVLTALQTQRKGLVLAVSAVLLVLFAQSIRLGASDLPTTYDRLLNPMTAHAMAAGGDAGTHRHRAEGLRNHAGRHHDRRGEDSRETGNGSRCAGACGRGIVPGLLPAEQQAGRHPPSPRAARSRKSHRPRHRLRLRRPSASRPSRRVAGNPTSPRSCRPPANRLRFRPALPRE